MAAGSFGSSHVLLAYRRAVSSDVADTHLGFIVDLCVVFADKGEHMPPNYLKVGSTSQGCSSSGRCLWSREFP